MEDVAAKLDLGRLTDEAAGLLSSYLAIDTTNPPGDVSGAADWVEGVLESVGIPTKRLGASKDKANVIATIEGSDGVRPFVLSHHMDVVAAPTDGWSVDPFGGLVKDGYVWGRGALDMKGFGILTIVCALEVARMGLELRRPLRLLITADEEVGGEWGAKWLAQNHLDEAGGEFLWTEGSFGRKRGDTFYYAVQMAEKGVSAVKLTVRGEPGHASAPTEDNAVVRMAAALSRIGAYRSPLGARNFTMRFLEGLPSRLTGLERGKLDELTNEQLEAALQRLRTRGDRPSNMMRNTFTPTMVAAGVGQNVIPAVCEAHVDCRTNPGIDGEQLLAELTGVIDDPTVQLELVKNSVGTESPGDTEFFAALHDAIEAVRPGATIVPYMSGGGTDSKHLRPAGIVCYGLIPFEPSTEELHGIHGFDERVSIEDIELGLRIMFPTVLRMCAAAR